MSEQQARPELPEDMKRMADSVKSSNGLLGPYDVSEDLKPTFDELELWEPLDHFREHGYAVIPDIAPAEAMDDLRAAIHALAEETPGQGSGHVAPFLLGRHPGVDRIATAPKILAFAEASVGKGVRASQFVGSIKRQGNDGGESVHADQNWVPAPFPEHNLVITFCIPCEGMTAEGGATIVVPNSHKKRRHPTAEETKSDTVSIEVEKGSTAVWDGSVWHGTGRRDIPGTRTVLHATYQRLYTQPIDDYSYLLEDADYLASAPEAMRSLLGADLFFGTSSRGHMIDMAKFGRCSLMSKL